MQTAIEIAKIIGAVLVSALGAGGIVTVYLKAKLRRSEDAASARRKLLREITVKERHLLSCICRVIYWVVFCANKHEIPENGELTAMQKAFGDMEKTEGELKEIERQLSGMIDR